MTEPRPRGAHWLAGAALAYAVAYHLGLLFIDPTTRTSTVWPASGVALAALLLTPKERKLQLYATLALTGLVSNMLAFGSLHTLRDAAAGIGALAGNLLELFLAGWLLERVTERATFERVREVTALVCAAIAACMVGSALGSGSITLAHGVPFWATQRNFWVGDGLGVLMVTPLVVCWARPGSSWRAPRWLEAVGFLTLFSAVAWLTFRRESLWGGASPGPYVLLGLLAWPALRLGQRFVTLALALLALVAISSTRSGMWHSPWGGKTLHEQLLLLQTYLGFASGSALLFAASVAELRRAEQASRHDASLLQQFVKHTPAAVAMFDNEMRYLQASDRWLADYHLQGQEIVGRSHYDVFPDIPERWRQVHQRVLKGAVERNDDDAFPRDDGRQEWLQWEVRPWHNPDGAIGGLVMFTQVITERKLAELRNRQLQEQLREAQKLESLGTLAGGIAHDFNNILSAIVAYTQIAQLDNPSNAELQSQLGEVMKSSNRAAKLVQQILSFSRQQPQERRSISLSPVYTDAVKLLRATLPATIELREHVADNLPEVLGDPAQVHQVLMNLCTNASHAMKGRGVLRLELSRYTLAEGAVSPHLDLRPGQYLKLSVTDDGQGMEPHVLSRIFEPFFTTKSSGEGSGLGLAVVHGIVKEHEGVITVDSEPGRGTTFCVYLPALAAAELPLNEALVNVPLGHGEHVLFVDDEAALCVAAKQTLTRLGYTPHVFQDPQAAWRAFQAEPHTFHVLLTDLTMPGRTGLDLAGDVLRLRPNLPVILATGYSATLTPEALEERGIAQLLFKPLDYQGLAAALAQVLPPPLERTA
ncbi:MAG TPA: ATP-binding protein [Polyangiaceae bacterium]|nr:ATP-binding protein [Polyangiaceae bacterium]